MISTVFLKSFSPEAFDRKEILRYASCCEASFDVEAMLDECITECKGVIGDRVCYVIADVSVNDGCVDLGFGKIRSASLARSLGSSEKAVIFAATAGIGIDRLISRYLRISPAKALIFDAIGAERTESLCDAFCEYIAKETGGAGRRFSPGYGDLPLGVQRDIFRILHPEKYLGLCLNESLIMSPSKSVTAIMGISQK